MVVRSYSYFYISGTFVTPGSFSETVEYFIVAGGGGGGADNYPQHRGAGGGGAGGLRTGTTPIGASHNIYNNWFRWHRWCCCISPSQSAGNGG